MDWRINIPYLVEELLVEYAFYGGGGGGEQLELKDTPRPKVKILID